MYEEPHYPSTVYIGDSYLWVWAANRMMHNTSANWQLWYYFKEVYTDSTFKPENTQQIDNTDWGEELKNSDCVIILYTPANIKLICSTGDLVEKMYMHFCPR